eukprot:gene2834-4241_t
MTSEIKIQAVQTEQNAFTIFAPNLSDGGILFLLQKLQELNGVEVQYGDSTKVELPQFMRRLKEEQSVSMNLQISQVENTTLQVGERIDELEKKVDHLHQKVNNLQLPKEVSKPSFIDKKITKLTDELNSDLLSEKKKVQIAEKLEFLKKQKLDKETSKNQKQIQMLTEKLDSGKLCEKRRLAILEKIQNLKQGQKRVPSSVEKKIQSLTEKLSSNLPEKRKIQIAEKIQLLKAQQDFAKKNVCCKIEEEWLKFKNVQQ